ncbi:hypothetical protein ACP0HM_19730 [Escherichia coli]
MAFVSLKPWEERNGDENSAEAVIHRAKMELGKIRDGFCHSIQYASHC